MTMNHTQGKWTYAHKAGSTNGLLLEEDESTIMAVVTLEHSTGHSRLAANLQRICAAINFADGIPLEELVPGALAATDLDAEPVHTRAVTIPACEQHEGIYSQTVMLPWKCIHCGGPRGEPRHGLSYDGSLRMNVDTWDNPCGHVEKYSEIRNWILSKAVADMRKARIAQITIPATIEPNLTSENASIFDEVVEAMQAAEELGGPEGDDYVTLMRRIAAEANQRIENFNATRTNDQPPE